ncbi:DUF2239 family protein [Alicyclobacillus sp. ALC3]|uniref:DUF2239 family protein n=1 Tax=Alicyclobacillus sp. ALC3 TaxID=2796143 RepID=UPI002377E159|nr:DUF2239 family protein [Alicyclobacillus sp. ALC3]WDL98615.1 DUF2239 family protein [Alicyclobacillus sp. ALC3]
MSTSQTDAEFTAFLDDQLVASGSLQDVIQVLNGQLDSAQLPSICLFDDATGRPVDLDVRHGVASAPAANDLPATDGADHGQTPTDAPRSVGRPKLGVVAGEVTLLPRHWAWLKSQPGGASVTLRKLVEEARRTTAGEDIARRAQEAAYRVMTALAGDRSNYEEALRALYAKDEQRFLELTQGWSQDVCDYVRKLAKPVFAQKGSRVQS